MPAPSAPVKKAYRVVHAFWHDGLLRPAGDTLQLTDHQAKHLVLAGNVEPQ